MRSVLLLFALFVLNSNVKSQSYDNMKKLYSDMVSNYSKSVIPTTDQNQTLYMGVLFYLAAVIDFKAVEETILLTSTFQLNWTDSSLIWNPVDYGNIYYQLVYSTDIWTPPVMLTNGVGKMEKIGGDTDFITYVLSTGQVIYSPGDVLEVKCPTDVSKFPFDTQTCFINLMAWGLPANVLTFQSLSSEANLLYFTPHSDWQLVEYKTYTRLSGVTSLINVKVTLKRAPLYYSIMVIIPTFAFAILNPVVFLLPTETGDRVGFSMTILLSYAIFLTLVSASIPASSNPMCALLIIMVVIIILSGIIVGVVVLSSKYYHEQDNDNIPAFLKRIVKWRLRKKKNSVKSADEEIKLVIKGKDVASAFDSFFFWASYLAIIIIAIAYFSFVLT